MSWTWLSWWNLELVELNVGMNYEHHIMNNQVYWNWENGKQCVWMWLWWWPNYWTKNLTRISNENQVLIIDIS